VSFTIRGTVHCLTPRGVLEVAGAEVEIFRYVSWRSDDRVAVTYTDAHAQYSVFVETDGVDDYYARVRLTDGQHVHLEEAVNSSTWSVDSQHQRNDASEIVADFVLEKDGGLGTPECEIWMGVKAAYDEYVATVQEDPPQTDYKILLWKTIQTPYSYLATINWPENYSPGYSSSDRFERFRTAFHEFGHTIRHSLDGDWNHFLADAINYMYAQFHGFCQHPGGGGPAGFAFNEGWANFWSNVGQSCAGEEDNFELEGNVARDLLALSRCPGVGRAGMVGILKQGQNIVHSEDEFRDRFQTSFPNCPLPPRDGRGVPLSAALAIPPPIVVSQLASTLERDIADIHSARAALESKLDTLLATRCFGARCIDRDLRVEVARARIAAAQLALGMLRQDLLKVREGQMGFDYTSCAREAWETRAQHTTAARRDIVVTALRRIAPLLRRRGDAAEAARVAEQLRALEGAGALSDPALLNLADARNLRSDDLDLPPPANVNGCWQVLAGLATAIAIGRRLFRRPDTTVRLDRP
jgi:hypothetical protein